MPHVCRHHWNIGVKAVRKNPKYRGLPAARKRKIAGRIAWMLERAHGRHNCKGRVRKI